MAGTKLVLCAAVALSALSGCGGDDKTSNVGQPAATQCPPGQYFDGRICQSQTGAPVAGGTRSRGSWCSFARRNARGRTGWLAWLASCHSRVGSNRDAARSRHGGRGHDVDRSPRGLGRSSRRESRWRRDRR